MDDSCEDINVTPECNFEQSCEKFKMSEFPQSQFPTLYGEIREKNVCFCIDTSGSMVYSLGAVKEHTLEALQQLSQTRDRMFNIVEFSTDVQMWSDKLVTCSGETVNVAKEWIKELQPKTGTNTLNALLAAFKDEECEAIYLVTDGLPDQNTSEILNEVSHVALNRPVHCYFIKGENSDPSAVDFLQDLAMETYGSFHIINIATQGTVERITPVYRAEKSAEQIIRTTNGNIYSGTDKYCTVGATLNTEPFFYNPGVVVSDAYSGHPIPTIVPGAPFTYYAYPHFRFYHNLPYFHPHLGWSRYRPAKAWSKHVEGLLEGPEYITWAPGAGSILIDKKVLARRNEDGYFYKGIVKSQLLDNKFLIQFGPNKHGKYKETSYQETYIYDILSLEDAMRHSLLPNDKVLSPWQPEGERYAPAVVLEGQERRTSTVGSSEDSPITISTSQGQTVQVPSNTAVWIPAALHERIDFELKLPVAVRQRMATQDMYPGQNAPGYPTSGPVAVPEEWDKWQSIAVDRSNSVGKTRGLFKDNTYVPLYTMEPDYMSREYIESGNLDLIPGTDYTTTKLREKVLSQIEQHHSGTRGSIITTSDHIKQESLKHDEGYATETSTGYTTERDSPDFSRTESSLKKSVSFTDVDSSTGLLKQDVTLIDKEDSALLAEYLDTETKGDSGFGGSCPDLTDLEIGEYLKDESKGDTILLKNRPRQSKTELKAKPSWKYWRNDPPPNLLHPLHYGPYRMGPYEDAAIEQNNSIETSAANISCRGAEENAESMSRFVNPLSISSYNENTTVGDCMYNPRPPDVSKPRPSTAHPIMSNGHDANCNLRKSTNGNVRVTVDLNKQPTFIQKPTEEARMQYRTRERAMREKNLQDKNESEIAKRTQIREWHREKTRQHISQEQERRQNEMNGIARQQEARRALSQEINTRHVERSNEVNQKHADRLNGLRNERYEREKVEYHKRREMEQAAVNKQIARSQTQQARVSATQERMAEDNAKQNMRASQMQNAKLQRIQQFRDLEQQRQFKKDLNIQVTVNSQPIPPQSSQQMTCEQH